MLSSLGVAPVSEVLSSLSSVNSATSDHSANHTPDASLQPSISTSIGRRKPINLSLVSVQATNIPPKETVVYSKQTQTTSTGGHNERDGESFHYDISLSNQLTTCSLILTKPNYRLFF